MSALTEWIGRSIGLRSRSFWSDWIPTRNSTGKPVTQDTVLTVAAAWACVRLLSEAVGLLPYFVFRRDADGSRVVVTDHPLYSLLHDMPNPDFTAPEFWEAVTACMALDGNAFGLKMKVGSRTVGVELIDPRAVHVRRDPINFQLRYNFSFRGKAYTDMTDADVIHWRGFGLGRDRGLSAVHYGANTIGIAMAADDSAGGRFRGKGDQAGFIQTPTKLTDQQRTDFKKSLGEFRNGTDPTGIMLLEQGFEWKSFGFNPNDLQLLQARGFSVEQVCSLFRVQPFMIGHSEKSTSWGTGLEQTVQSFLTFALMPYLKKIQTRNNMAFLTRQERAQGLYTEFAIEGLLQADSEARAKFYAMLAQNGIMTRAEIRERENLPKIAGSDQLTAQSNLVPLDKLGEIAASGGNGDPLRQALRSFLQIEDHSET